MRVCHMHFRYRRLDKCYSRIHSHSEFTQVELCLLVPDTKPFLTEFTTGLHSRYHSDSSNRNIPSFVQINHILDCKPHTQAGFYTQRYKLLNPQASFAHLLQGFNHSITAIRPTATIRTSFNFTISLWSQTPYTSRISHRGRTTFDLHNLA